MPLIEFLPTQPGDTKRLLPDTTRAVVECLGKPESSVMVQVQDVAGSFGGSDEPSCCIRVSQIGEATLAARAELTRQLTGLAAQHFKLAEDRVFTVFQSVPRSHWGKGGQLLSAAPQPAGGAS
jgi:phenylpyruvate tautomerase PptA (4-oxalocrotonate tautomerase family)